MRKIILTLCTLFLSLAHVTAHPHMFIDTRLAIEIEEETLKGIRITWWFDPVFTASIRGDFDEDKNGTFNKEEIEEIREYAFSNLVNYNYFTFVNHGSTTLVPGEIKNFSAWIEDGTLVYQFYAPFELTIEEKFFSVAIYDDTFWCDITYKKTNPVTLPGMDNAKWELVENRNRAIAYDNTVAIDRTGKAYTGTAYPQQIVVRLP